MNTQALKTFVLVCLGSLLCCPTAYADLGNCFVYRGGDSDLEGKFYDKTTQSIYDAYSAWKWSAGACPRGLVGRVCWRRSGWPCGNALPHALARKYPNANQEWCWQFVFPQERRWRNSKTGEQGRHHIDESLFSRSLKAAVKQAGLTKRVTSHTFRHSFATHLLADGYDIRTVQELLGHKDVRTTMIYTHVLNRGGRGVRSPADGLTRGPGE